MAETADNTEVICANPDCQVAETGKCVEGFETSTCPHFGRPPAGVHHDEVPSDEPRVSGGVRLPISDTLVVADTNKLLRAGDTRVIAIVGPSDAGKTSLIASLYDLFQAGPVLGIDYARSLTLHAFERTCHDARAASRRGVPHVNRTPRGEVRFYHLHLGGGSAGKDLALAIADRAGEEYRSATDDLSIVSDFPEVHRADSLTALVDGERLLDTGERHNVRSEITMMLQALVDAHAVQEGQRFALVLTKMDLLQSLPNKDRADRDFENLFSSLQHLFGHFFSAFQSFRVAASPKSDIVPRGDGVPQLLMFWLHQALAAPTPPMPRPMSARAFARLRPIDESKGDA